MTREEAIKYLKEFELCVPYTLDAQGVYKIARDMAIKELEQEPCVDCISRKAVLEYIKDCDAELMHDVENESVREDILNMPSVIPILPKGATNGDMVIEQEPKTGQEINGDYISREKTLEKFCDYVGSGMSMNDFDALYDIILKMPSVQPNLKTGHWIMHDKHRECSKCNVWFPKDMPRNSYCPNCGAKMESE